MPVIFWRSIHYRCAGTNHYKERADYCHEQHRAWTHSDDYFGTRKPSDVFQQHFSSCFIDDAYGLRNLALIGEDNVCYEVDYPHSDASWPNGPELLWRSIQVLSDVQIDKVTHRNAMRLLRFDQFKNQPRAAYTVGALRAKAKAAGVDTSLKSGAGAAPFAAGEALRRVSSGDIIGMFMAQSEAA